MKKSLLILLLALPLTGCETLANLNPFDKKQEPLPGERNAVFPKGLDTDRSIPQPYNPSGAVEPPKPDTAKKRT